MFFVMNQEEGNQESGNQERSWVFIFLHNVNDKNRMIIPFKERSKFKDNKNFELKSRFLFLTKQMPS